MPYFKIYIKGKDKPIEYYEDSEAIEFVKQKLDEKFAPLKEFAQKAWGGMSPFDKAALATAPLPVIGDIAGLVADADMFINDPESRTMLNAGLSAAGLIPLVPALSTARKAAKVPGERTIYAGTKGDYATEIKPYETHEETNLFGGIFGSFDKDVAGSHGETIQEITSKNHISHDDFRRNAMYDNDTSPEYFKEMKSEISDLKGETLSGDEATELMDYIIGDKRINNDDPEMGVDRFKEILNVGDDKGKMDWDLQGLKGELAKRKGYTSVGMEDEHGESVLALSGADIVSPKFDPAKSKSANLLTGGAAATVGTSAYLSKEDEDAL